MHISRLLPAAMLTLALGACTAAQRDQTLAIVCASVPTAELAFQQFAPKASAATRNKVRSLAAGAQAYCATGNPKDVAGAVRSVNAIITAIVAETERARRAGA